MARARNIKPGFFTNDALGELPPLARLLFAGLWTICDRAGRVEDRPKKIRAEVLPYDECDADLMLDQLAAAGFIARYTAEGVAVIQVLAWEKHQNPHVKEGASTLPEQCKSGASLVQEQGKAQPLPERAGLIPSLLIPSSLIPDSASLRSEDPPPAGVGNGAKPVKTPKAERGSRLSKDWLLPRPWGEWALSRFPHWTAEIVRDIALTFLNHWTSKTGKDATKLDWEATWQNWCMSAITQKQYPQPRNGPSQAPLSFRERDAEAAAQRIARLTGGMANAPLLTDQPQETVDVAAIEVHARRLA